MPDDADLSLPALATMIAEFLTELDLRHVTVVCNDWGGAQLLISPGGTDRVANLVLVSCEAFDNYPPGLPGRLLCHTAALPGGTFLTRPTVALAPDPPSPRDLRRPVQAADSRRPVQELDPSAAPQPQGPPRPTSATSPNPSNCSSGPTSSAPSPARSSSGHDMTNSCPPPTPNEDGVVRRSSAMPRPLQAHHRPNSSPHAL